MSSLAIAFPPLLDSNDVVVGNINEEDDGPLLAQPPAVAIPNRHWIDEAIAAREPSSPNGYHPMMGAFTHPAGVRSDRFLKYVGASHSISLHRQTDSVDEAQVACDQLIGALDNLGMGADDDAAAAPVLDPPARRAIIIQPALVDDDMWPEDNNVIIRPERNVVRCAVVEPALRPFRDFANLHHRDHPGAPLHAPILGTKRTSERLLARTRCFRLAPRMMHFEESDNEWGPPSFLVLDADEDSDNTSSSSTEDEE